ncbi:hypothetical protein [Ekhidna sp.]|uniref:hypothetical protein n=1 Tax=Ekhidna sp. TaxID=2608089 RepID=UPI0032971A12
MKLTITLVPLLLISCLPTRLVPHDFSIEKQNHEAYIELDSVTVALVNLKAKGDHYVFRMEIENKSTQPIFINLKKMYKYAHRLSYRNEEAKLFPEVTPVMTSDQVNAFFKSKKKDGEAAALFLFLVGAAISTYDAVKDQEDDRKSYWTHEDENKSTTRDLITTTTLIATDVLTDVALKSSENAHIELTYLPDELFDREIIYPGERYYGKILFKNFGEIKKHHRISFPLEDKKLHFDFRKANGAERRFLHEEGW